MKTRYLVHSAVAEPVAQRVKLPNGQEVDATVSGMTVELVEENGPNTITRRFFLDDPEAAAGLFEVGSVVIVNFTAEGASAKASAAPKE